MASGDVCSNASTRTYPRFPPRRLTAGNAAVSESAGRAARSTAAGSLKKLWRSFASSKASALAREPLAEKAGSQTQLSAQSIYEPSAM